MTATHLATTPGDSADVSPEIVQLRAPNADEWTYGGTNTWILGGAVPGRCVVVDPGTADEAHAHAVREAARRRGWRIAAVALTHDHEDHSDGARELADAAGAPILGLSPAFADVLVGDGEDLSPYGARARVLATPGHSDDSICFDVRGMHLVTGDTLLGGHSSGVYGSFGEYLDSLERIARFVSGRTVVGLPGHGSLIPHTLGAARQVLAVRRRRVRSVRTALATRPDLDVVELTSSMYPSVVRFHWASAVQMVVGIAGYLSDVDERAPAEVRAAYARVAAVRVDDVDVPEPASAGATSNGAS